MNVNFRHPALWSELDGDINAVPIPQPYGRPVNSDIVDLCAKQDDSGSPVTVRDSILFSHAIVFRNMDGYHVVHPELMQDWLEEQSNNPSESGISSADADAIIERIESIHNISEVPRDEECKPYRYRKFYSEAETARLLPPDRAQNSIATLLWGGAEVIDVVLKGCIPASLTDGYRYDTHPLFNYTDIETLIRSSWNMSGAVTFREMVMVTLLLNNKFLYGDLTLAELVYAVSANRPLLTSVGTMNNWTAYARSSTLEGFRDVCSDSSAVLWSLSLEQAWAATSQQSINDTLTLEDRFVEMAASFSFPDVCRYFEHGIYKPETIADAITNGIDADTIRAVVGSNAT